MGIFVRDALKVFETTAAARYGPNPHSPNPSPPLPGTPRSSLEHAYSMAASYGKEEAESSMRAHQHQHQHALAGRGVPESSQEIMHDTQVCVRGPLTVP